MKGSLQRVVLPFRIVALRVAACAEGQVLVDDQQCDEACPGQIYDCYRPPGIEGCMCAEGRLLDIDADKCVLPDDCPIGPDVE